jgi:hypothetical protein
MQHATGQTRSVQNIFVKNLDGKTPIGRHKHRWEDNIKTDLREMLVGSDWIQQKHSVKQNNWKITWELVAASREN